MMQVVQLMMVDCKQAVNLLIQNRDLIAPSEVVSQLLNTRNKCDSRYFLHLYLHSLFEVNPHAGKDFHDMQVWIRQLHQCFNSIYVYIVGIGYRQIFNFLCSLLLSRFHTFLWRSNAFHLVCVWSVFEETNWQQVPKLVIHVFDYIRLAMSAVL